MVRYESVVLDGAAIDALLADDAARERLCAELFAEYDANKDGSLSKAEIKPAVLGLGIDMGLPPPGTEAEADALVAEAFREIDADSSGDVSLAEFEGFVCGVLAQIAAGLRRTPVVVESATFDGDLIRRLLKDEDAPGTLALMCAEMFKELDVDKSGKLSNVELRPLLEGLAEKMDVPPASPESVAFFDAVFEAADWNGDRELDASEFADLIKGMLEVVADRLAENPITVTKSSTAEVDVFDGTLLKALLADEGAAGGAFKEAVVEQFKALDQNGDGKLSLSELRTAIDTITQDDSVPLPPTAQNDKAADRLELSVSKVFDEIDTDHSGEVDLEEFEAHTRKVLASVASLLEEAPIIIVRSSEYTTVSAEDGAPAPAEGAE